jgi:hypothetical protein
MQASKKIDFARLLGFEMVSDQISGSLDFQDEIVGDKLGAKVGPIEPSSPIGRIDYNRILGFQTVSDQISGSL